MMTLSELLDLIQTLLTRVGSNRISGDDMKQACLAIVNFFATQIAEIVPDWSAAATFQTDGTDAGKYSVYPDTNGRKRLFLTKVDDNINNAPPSAPEITENAYWIEVSASQSASIPEWAVGVYGPGLIIVYHNHSVDGRGLYVLLDPARPFSSANIETEITAFKWERLGGAAGAGSWGSITGTVTDQADLVAYIAAQIASLVDSAPGALDTLNELAAALGDDANFAATVTTALASKASNASVALKLDAGQLATVGTVIKWDVPRCYGKAAAETGNITSDETSAIDGMTQLLIHNNGAAPTFSAVFKKLTSSGSYVTGVNNYIWMHRISSTKIQYTISQEI